MLYFKHKSFEEIYNNSSLIINFSIVEIIILVSIITLILLFIFYILPVNEILTKFRINKSESRKRKKLLNQIMAQKEIESEIEEEIKNYNLKS